MTMMDCVDTGIQNATQGQVGMVIAHTQRGERWRMVTITECARKNFCVDCDDPHCIHAGDIEADCPKWKCDNDPIMDCKRCEFLKEYKREVTE